MQIVRYLPRKLQARTRDASTARRRNAVPKYLHACWMSESGLHGNACRMSVSGLYGNTCRMSESGLHGNACRMSESGLHGNAVRVYNGEQF